MARRLDKAGYKRTAERLKNDPVLFVRKMIGAEPTEQQAQLLRSVVDNDATAVKSGHGTGKTTAIAWIILWFITTHDECVIPCTAPTSHQLRNILWPELEKWKYRSKLNKWIRMHKQKIWWVGQEEKRYGYHVSVNTPENLQGVHSKNVLYLIDEIGGLNPVLMPVIEGAMTTENTKIVGAGNPTRTDGILFDAFHSQASFWNQLTFSSLNSPNVQKNFVKMMGEKYGYDSDVFRVRVLGEFPSKSSDSLIEIALVYDALHRDIGDDYKNNNIHIGVDVARYGDDSSVIIVRNDRELISIKEYHGYNTMRVAGEAINIYNEYIKDNNCKIYVDGIGVGSGVVDRLEELKYPVEDVVSSEKPSKEYANSVENLKAELWARMKLWLKTASFLVEEERMVAELSSMKYLISSNGKIRMEKKEDFKKRIGNSPDMADALAVTFKAPKAVGIVTVGKPRYRSNDGY